MSNIEDTIFDDGMAVNTLAMLNRMKEILDDNQTNCLLNCKDDPRVKRLLWLLNSQVYGQMARIDMVKEWDVLNAGKGL